MSEQTPSSYPAPNYDTDPYQQQAPQTEKTNTLAILSLVFGFLVNIVGIVLGFVALNQIKRTGEKGRGLAITGIVVGFISLISGIIFAILMLAGLNEVAKSAAAYESSAATASSSSASALATEEVSEEASEAADDASSVASDTETTAALDPASPYCVALDEFLVASDDIQQDATTLDGYLASLTKLRDNAPTEEMRASLTTAIDAVNASDAATFESALNEVVFGLGLDAVNCGIE